MICVLSFSILAVERKAQLADEGLWFSCLLSGKGTKKDVEVGCKWAEWGKTKAAKEKGINV